MPNCEWFINYYSILLILLSAFVHAGRSDLLLTPKSISDLLNLISNMLLIANGKCSCRFEGMEAPNSKSFFTEIIASISDIKFGKDGRYILSRDYMNLKVYSYLSAISLICYF